MPYTQTVQEVQKALTEAIAEIENCFEMSEPGRNYDPKDGGWSINANLEHTSLTNDALLTVIRRGCQKALKRVAEGAIIPDGESDMQRLEPLGHPDAIPLLRPEHLEPTITTPMAEVYARIVAQYQESQTLLASIAQGQGALHHSYMSVQDLGKLDMYQWLYFLTLHQKRHVIQMQRVYEEYLQQ